MDKPKSIHELVMELRNFMDDVLPEGVGVTIDPTDSGNNKGKVVLTIKSWPKSMNMLNVKRVKIVRYAVLAGRTAMPADLAGHPYLSTEASFLVGSLQNIVDRLFPSRTDPETNQVIWDTDPTVQFDENALERERIEIIQSMKEHSHAL